MQDSFSAFEECRKPVIAAIHGGCIGGGIDMVTACDLRYCTEVTHRHVLHLNTYWYSCQLHIISLTLWLPFARVKFPLQLP